MIFSINHLNIYIVLKGKEVKTVLVFDLDSNLLNMYPQYVPISIVNWDLI